MVERIFLSTCIYESDLSCEHAHICMILCASFLGVAGACIFLSLDSSNQLSNAGSKHCSELGTQEMSKPMTISMYSCLLIFLGRLFSCRRKPCMHLAIHNSGFAELEAHQSIPSSFKEGRTLQTSPTKSTRIQRSAKPQEIQMQSRQTSNQFPTSQTLLWIVVFTPPALSGSLSLSLSL